MAIKLKNGLFAGALLYVAVFALYGNSLVDPPNPYYGSEMGTAGVAYSGSDISGPVPYTAIGKMSGVETLHYQTEAETPGGGRLQGL